MQALIIAYETKADFAKRRSDPQAYEAYMKPWFDYTAELREAGALAGGEALQDPGTATRLSMKDGERQVEDGPFLDAKEQLGGFFLIDVDSMEDAVAWAAKCPAAKTGAVEVRAVPDYSEGA